MHKVEGEIQVEQARIEQVERDARLAKKQAAVQAVSPVPLCAIAKSGIKVKLKLIFCTRF